MDSGMYRNYGKEVMGMSSMNRLLYCLSGLMLTLAASSLAAQTCQTEAEIPSTTPSSRFTDHGDGTVTDGKTGLMWMKCPLGQSGNDCATGSATTYTWQEALEVADGYSFAGYTDWRLPNIKELRSIVEQRCYDPAINLEIFPATSSLSHVWSASLNVSDSYTAWNIYFYNGYLYRYYRDDSLQVRLVRFRNPSAK